MWRVLGRGGWLLLLEVGLEVEEEAEEKLRPYLSLFIRKWIILFNSCNIKNI